MNNMMKTIRKELLVNLMSEKAPARLFLTVKNMDENDFGYLVRGLNAVGGEFNVSEGIFTVPEDGTYCITRKHIKLKKGDGFSSSLHVEKKD